MNIFDIFIAYISWGDGGKTRPVLILEQQETVVLVFNITTQYQNKSEAVRGNYFKINDWQQAGLRVSCAASSGLNWSLPGLSVVKLRNLSKCVPPLYSISHAGQTLLTIGNQNNNKTQFIIRASKV